MSRLQVELAHMLRLMATPTSFRLWKAFLWDKAKRMADSDLEFSELPQLLTDAMKKRESSPSQSKQPEPGTPS